MGARGGVYRLHIYPIRYTLYYDANFGSVSGLSGLFDLALHGHREDTGVNQRDIWDASMDCAFVKLGNR